MPKSNVNRLDLILFVIKHLVKEHYISYPDVLNEYNNCTYVQYYRLMSELEDRGYVSKCWRAYKRTDKFESDFIYTNNTDEDTSSDIYHFIKAVIK